MLGCWKRVLVKIFIKISSNIIQIIYNFKKNSNMEIKNEN